MGNLTKSFTEFVLVLVEHPSLSLKELLRFSINSLGIKQKPSDGVLFETHCHTDFPCTTPNGLNDGMPLEQLIETCFRKDIEIVSITDHRNCDAFDSLVNKGLGEYDIERSEDRRYATIYDYDSDKEIIILRSAEFWTDQREVNVHGFAEKYPQKLLTLKDVSRIARDNGSFWIINHPLFYQGLDRKGIEKAIELGANGIELNSIQIPPFIFSTVTAQIYKDRTPIVAGDDAHYRSQIGNALVEFDRTEATNLMTNPIEKINLLISKRKYENIFNYSSFSDVLKMAIEHPAVVPVYN